MGDMKSNANTHATSLRSDDYGELQLLVDDLYRVCPSKAVSKLDVLERADARDLCDDLMEVIRLLPGGTYRRRRLCDQLNSIVTAHGWGYTYGTVD